MGRRNRTSRRGSRQSSRRQSSRRGTLRRQSSHRETLPRQIRLHDLHRSLRLLHGLLHRRHPRGQTTRSRKSRQATSSTTTDLQIVSSWTWLFPFLPVTLVLEHGTGRASDCRRKIAGSSMRLLLRAALEGRNALASPFPTSTRRKRSKSNAFVGQSLRSSDRIDVSRCSVRRSDTHCDLPFVADCVHDPTLFSHYRPNSDDIQLCGHGSNTDFPR